MTARVVQRVGVTTGGIPLRAPCRLRHPSRVDPDQEAILVFDLLEPAQVVVYPDLDWARGSLESLDVAGDGSESAFMVTGRVVQVEPSDDLFALFTVSEQVDLKRLQDLLRAVRGPAYLADDPAAYAQEWLRLDELDAQRPPFVPQRIWAWYRDKHPSGSSARWRL